MDDIMQVRGAARTLVEGTTAEDTDTVVQDGAGHPDDGQQPDFPARFDPVLRLAVLDGEDSGESHGGPETAVPEASRPAFPPVLAADRVLWPADLADFWGKRLKSFSARRALSTALLKDKIICRR